MGHRVGPLEIRSTRRCSPSESRSFTGSTATGKKVFASASADLKRATLELGGNDAAIVLSDADPGAIADKVFWGAFINSGQICLAIKRVYVHASIYDAVVEQIAIRAKNVRVGDGFDAQSQLGPLSNEVQFDKVSAYVADALDRGAVAVAGGAPLPGGGSF